ncbi:MAG: prolipoprotein diacylglyceryl transferase [Candidatus Nealsonbacteria bacterium]|nr:prolipoprotein diacylglyceryl transferase [Candidatus Nealsonbacteria bacterium]
MRQTLFHIPYELFDVPVFGFGLLLAVWIAFSVGLIAWLGWRQGFGRDTWGYLLLLVPAGGIIWGLLPALCKEQGLPIRGYGMMMLLAVVAGTGVAIWRARRQGLDPDLIVSLAFWMFVPGIIGARVFYVIQYWDQYADAWQQGQYMQWLGEVVNLSEGGQVVYGSFIGAVLGIVAFTRKFRLPLLPTLDLIAPGMVIGLALGRIGCLLNGCCFGGPCDDHAWAVQFPFNSPAHVHQARHSDTFLHGLIVKPDDDGRPIIEKVEPGSLAAQHGLKPGQQIVAVNGVFSDAVEHGKTDRIRWALLSAHQLHLRIKRPGERSFTWVLQTPPPPAGPVYRLDDGGVSIVGLRINGRGDNRPVVAAVQRRSLASREGVRPDDRIVAVNGEPVETVGDLRRLLELQRTEPWLSIATLSRTSRAKWTIEHPLPRSLPVHPTQIYSAINALLLCLLLLAYEPYRRRDGELFALMITIYAAVRYLLEMIRVDESGAMGTELTISQNVSLMILLGVSAMWVYIVLRPRTEGFAGCGKDSGE